MLQGIAHNAKLLFKLRFFFKDPLELTGPLVQRLYFMQVAHGRGTPLWGLHAWLTLRGRR
jgi:hypothetical protein